MTSLAIQSSVVDAVLVEMCKLYRQIPSVPTIFDPKVPRILFYDAGREHGFCSNYFVLKKPLVWCGKEYKTSEHAYQSARFISCNNSFGSMWYAEKIRKAPTPNAAREMSRLRVGTRFGRAKPYAVDIEEALRFGLLPDPDWEKPMLNSVLPRKVSVMLEVVTLKFLLDDTLQKKLLDTGTAELIEHTSLDAFWGDDGTPGVGKNWLGVILMVVRDVLRKRGDVAAPVSTLRGFMSLKRKQEADEDDVIVITGEETDKAFESVSQHFFDRDNL
jgi:predicted NAD-dependent protein-ADP-ribosyltransferase YbiA (DUF1768 family)